MHLRNATLEDLSLLRYWDTKPHVIAAGGNDDCVNWAAELKANHDWGEILIAEQESRAIGVIQIIDPAREETHYWGDVEPDLRAIDIWIGEESDLGRGYGTELMGLAIDHCFADSAVKAILIDPLASNTRACRFYERLGFALVGPRRFGDDDCLVYRLDREACLDGDHMH